MSPRFRSSQHGALFIVLALTAPAAAPAGQDNPPGARFLHPIAREPGPSDRVHPDVHVGKARAVTGGPNPHFFGYYGISPWNPSETMMVGLETGFDDRLPEPGEPATIGSIDAVTGAWRPLAETRAWNFQQGCMLHWLSDRRILFNDCRSGRIVSVILDVPSRREVRVLDRPIAAVHWSGKVGLSVNFARMGRIRKVVGVAGLADPTAGETHPNDDGVWRVDLDTGESRLIVTLDQIYRCRPLPAEQESDVWINHVLINTDASRFLALVRRGKQWHTMMFTAGLDGSDLRCVLPAWSGVSHLDWASPARIVATFRPSPEARLGHYLLMDGREGFDRLGDGVLDYDSHCSVSPCGRWVITDSYPHTRQRLQQLLLYDLKTGMYRVLGVYPQRASASKEVRCDLHPRWSPSGRQICFDSTHGSQRQMYVLDVRLLR